MDPPPLHPRGDVSVESKRCDWLWGLTVRQHLDPFLQVVVLRQRRFVSGELWPVCAGRALTHGVQVVLKAEGGEHSGASALTRTQKHHGPWGPLRPPLTLLLSSLFNVGSLKFGPGSAGKSSLWMEKSCVCSVDGFVTMPT